MVIDSTMLDVRDGIWIGDLTAAAVSFPGAVFKITPTDRGAMVHGTERPITLLAGGNLKIDLSDRVEGFELELSVVRRAYLERERWFMGDMRLLVLTGAVVLFGMWVDTVNRWARTNPEVVAEIEALPALWTRVSPASEPQPVQPTHRTTSVEFRD